MNHSLFPDFSPFLRDLTGAFQQESLFLMAPDEASPEAGEPKAHPESFALDIFPPEFCPDTREFDRGALGLLAFFLAERKNAEHWPISQEDAQFLFERAAAMAPWPGAFPPALLFNDLGKTRFAHDSFQTLFGRASQSHDERFGALLSREPALFPGFASLGADELLFAQRLASNPFNLGAILQMEAPDERFFAFKREEASLRDALFAERLFDILGATGAASPRVFSPQVFNLLLLEGARRFWSAEDPDELREWRMESAGLKSLPGFFGRLLALSRCHLPMEASLLRGAFSRLDKEDQETIAHELALSGAGPGQGAFEHEHLPAFFAAAANSLGHENGWLCAMRFMACAMRRAHAWRRASGAGIFPLHWREIALSASLWKSAPDPEPLVLSLGADALSASLSIAPEFQGFGA